jgi:hypothetical protein
VTAFNLVQFFDKLDRAFDEVADTSSKNTARDPVPISALNQALYDLAQEKPTKLLSSSLRAVLFLRDACVKICRTVARGMRRLRVSLFPAVLEEGYRREKKY